MRRLIRGPVFAILLVLSVVVAAPAAYCSTDYCEHYPDTTPTYISGYGFVCAGWGFGCSECVDTSDGSSCVTDGNFCSGRVQHPTP